MMRFLLLSLSILFAAPAYWTQKSIGTNPVGPFSLARLDTTIDGQIHDTADTLRKYTLDRIKDSLTALRAASTLQAAYGASMAPQITTSTAKGPLTIRRGSASDPDAVLSVQDGSGAQTAYIGGNGAVVGSQVNVSSATANTLARFDAAKYLTSYALTAGDIPALPAYVRRVGDTITGPIVGTTATAAPLINITTTFGNLANAAIRGTASAAGGSAIYGIATGANGAGIRGSSTGSTGYGGFFSGANGSEALRAYAIGGGDAGRFEGNVKILGTTTLASSLTGILKANAGVVSVADTSDFPTRPYLPIAAGSGSPLTGVLYGQGLNFTTTANAPITISQNLAGGFTHPFQAFNSGMVAGNQYNFDFGQSASTNNAGNFGFKYVGAGSSSNYVTLGMYGANDLMTITAAGVPKFSGLTASKFVKTDASKNLVSTDVAYSDLTGAVPTWNQSTTGNAATATKWATARNLTIGSSTQAIDGTSDKTFTLAAIGAQAAGSYQPLEDQRLSTGNGPTFAQLKIGGATGTGTTTAKPLVVRSASSGVTAQIETGATGAIANILFSAPAGSWAAGMRADGLGGAPADAFTINDNVTSRAWFTSAGLTLPPLAGATTRIATINAAGQIGTGEVASTSPQAFGSNINLSSVTSRTLYPTASGLSITIPTSGVTLGQTFKLSTNAYSVTILCPGVTVYYAGTTFTSGSSITNSVMVDIVCLSATIWAIGIN